MSDPRRDFLERLHGKLVGEVARSPERVEDAEDVDRDAYLHVVVGSEHMALPVAAVEEVVIDPHLTPVPRAPAVVLGIFVHRGALVPVVDTARLTGATGGGEGRGRIVVAGQGEDAVGLEVSATLGVIHVDLESWRELPRETWRYITRAARLSGTLVGLLDVAQILGMDVVAEATGGAP
ncbi:MAG: chemotaxis protein CheW [Acidobacteriota bacterium]